MRGTVRVGVELGLSLMLIGSIYAGTPNPQNFPNAWRIHPWKQNPWYWCYKGKPILLAGGSKDDNLFQIPDLVTHLDEIRQVGGNYIRNTMSDRHDKGFEVYPFLRLPNGKYDLNRWNPEYWNRLDRLLREAFARDIIVQIEVWDRFDYSRQPWETHPYNPKNNINYTYAESGFAEHYPGHPGLNRQPFFFTTPDQRNNQLVFQYQAKFVRELLRHTLPYPNVLYCIDNETSGDPKWSAFWARFIRKEAQKAGKPVCITEMWDSWDLKSAQHRQTFDHPELYDFVDVSQNNHQKGETHWKNFLWVRRYLAKHPRPMNTVKTYGADTGRYGTSQDGLERWWRHLIAGAAAVRFHRPPSGLGLSAPAKASIRALRLAEQRVRFWELNPHMELLTDRESNEAYLAAAPDRAYVVYFTHGGKVGLNLRNVSGKFRLEWIDINRGIWGPKSTVSAGKVLSLQAPGKGHWLAVLTRTKR